MTSFKQEITMIKNAENLTELALEEFEVVIMYVFVVFYSIMFYVVFDDSRNWVYSFFCQKFFIL